MGPANLRAERPRRKPLIKINSPGLVISTTRRNALGLLAAAQHRGDQPFAVIPSTPTAPLFAGLVQVRRACHLLHQVPRQGSSLLLPRPSPLVAPRRSTPVPPELSSRRAPTAQQP